jgi:hypothetical protein
MSLRFVHETQPSPVTADDLQRLLHTAWEGADPAAAGIPGRVPAAGARPRRPGN